MAKSSEEQKNHNLRPVDQQATTIPSYTANNGVQSYYPYPYSQTYSYPYSITASQQYPSAFPYNQYQNPYDSTQNYEVDNENQNLPRQFPFGFGGFHHFPFGGFGGHFFR